MNETQVQKLPVIVIFAPTASGKTALTKELFCAQGSHFLFKAEVHQAQVEFQFSVVSITNWENNIRSSLFGREGYIGIITFEGITIFNEMAEIMQCKIYDSHIV